MQSRLGLLPTIILLHIFTQVRAANFTFSFGSPSQCDNFPISWTGGTPPFQLVLTPVFGTPRTMSIPSSSFSNGHGTYQAQIPFSKSSKIIATMSDASGFGSGGTSEVLTVGSSISNTNCNTTDPGVDFFFELNTALQQCRPYTFGNYALAVQPITIMGIIPGGESFALTPPTGPTSFDWVADVAAGTSIIFLITDSKGRQGGSSDVKLVGVSDDSTCLDGNSPTSASVFPSPTSSSPAGRSGTASATKSATSSTNSGTSAPASGGSSSSKPSGGVIAGAVFAALFGILAIGMLVLFLFRRRRGGGVYTDTGSRFPYSRRRTRIQSVDLNQDPPPGFSDEQNFPVVNPYPYTPSHAGSQVGSIGLGSTFSPSSQNLLSGSQYTADAYPPMQSVYTPSAHFRSTSMAESGVAGQSSADRTSTIIDSTTSSAARRKAAMAGMPSYKAPTRFILHTDLEETQPEDDGGLVELPPQYSERRAPIPGLAPNATLSSPPPAALSGPPGLTGAGGDNGALR